MIWNRRLAAPLGVLFPASQASTVLMDTPQTTANADWASLSSLRNSFTFFAVYVGTGLITSLVVGSLILPSLLGLHLLEAPHDAIEVLLFLGHSNTP
jgi:hypothetical protein